MSRKSAGERAFDVCNAAFMSLFVLLCLYPFYYLLIYALSSPDLAAGGLTVFPKGLTLQNFRDVLELDNIASAAIVSVVRTALGTGLVLVACGFFGYLMTKKQMYFRRAIYRMHVFTMYFGAGLIPTYMVMRAYGFMNSFLVYVIPGMLPAYYVILIKTFVEQLPASLEESASLDGAGVIRCWARIVMPLSLPILATIAVFASVGQWNSWFDAHIYITERDLWPLQYVLYRYHKNASELAALSKVTNTNVAGTIPITPEAIRMTVTALITIPILCVYPFLQRFFVKGILLGAVKG